MRYKYYTIENRVVKANNLDKGRLQIGCFATDIGKPASNATIQIMTSGNDSKIIEELVTDVSGQTLEVDLPAPPIEYSMQPDQPKPYSEYDVKVHMDGYEDCIIHGVQIFPNTTANQNINLNPIKQLGNQLQVISISEPVLWGNYPPKTPEDSVKELKPPTGFVVLPKPVIPENIIVHNGIPTDKNAQNYKVPFKDYIKNVACCEIYSNWPQNTLRANILAIISFTLNRVYTEWYRAKGYNFTITNATSSDQAFTYGRNIFSEISTVVDEIFTTYITKPAISQPLFTQYCDGKKSMCPNWMSQWGSKALGDKGYAYIDILKNYYGYDIYLEKAEKVAGIPSSYPGSTLQMGSSGQNVRTIQKQLNAISNNYPALKKVKVDGVYGNDTRVAVEKFQEVFNLPTSGMVDFATWYKISEIYVAVTKMVQSN